MDSPLAVEATHVFTQNLADCYDDQTKEIVMKGINPISFKGLNLSITSEESKMINFEETPKVIISASGMCDAGRVRHHIKYNLWKPESTIVFAGYQAEGTLGRLLLDGVKSVKLFGDDIAVKAEIARMPAMSSHADQDGLLDWISAFDLKKPKRVFLVHGDDGSMKTFSELVNEKLGYTVDCPFSGSVFDLATNKWEAIGTPVEVSKAVEYSSSGIPGRRKSSDAAFDRLMSAYNKLLTAVRANYGGANKDLARFTDQILNLYDKWMR